MPNYTINKGTLAENMATAAIEYPFALVENMAGRAEELQRGRLVEAQGINLVGAVVVKVIIEIFTGMPGYAYSRNPYIVTGIGVVGAMVADIESDLIIEDIK